MKIRLSIKEIVLGSILLTAIMILTGCVSENQCNVNKAYDFALEISEQDPNEFAKQEGGSSSVYYEKSLTVANLGWFGFWPTEGKGVFIEIQKDGDLSVIEYDYNQMEKLGSGKIKPSEAKGKSFSYMNNERHGEMIGLSDDGSMVGYTKSKGKWKRKCYDASKIKEGMQIESLPLLSSKKVDEEEVKKFLDLVEKIRKKFPHCPIEK